NASLSSALKEKTPYEALYGTKLDLSMLRIFGCRMYVHVQKEKREDAKWHTERCIYLGFKDGYVALNCASPLHLYRIRSIEFGIQYYSHDLSCLFYDVYVVVLLFVASLHLLYHCLSCLLYINRMYT
ncbi:hypothetical protein M407DRAFT_78458, partial [Tulasnella calospora MUT 4182]